MNRKNKFVIFCQKYFLKIVKRAGLFNGDLRVLTCFYISLSKFLDSQPVGSAKSCKIVLGQLSKLAALSDPKF